MNHPVCSYVRPLRAGRLLESPLQAARFVSLLGYEKTTSVGGGARAEQWTSMHAFLCHGKGVSTCHYVLLLVIMLDAVFFNSLCANESCHFCSIERFLAAGDFWYISTLLSMSDMLYYFIECS